jgi:hypothetical protein
MDCAMTVATPRRNVVVVAFGIEVFTKTIVNDEDHAMSRLSSV